MIKKENLISFARIGCYIILMIIWFVLHFGKQHEREADLSLSDQKQMIRQATQQNVWVRSDVQGSRSDHFVWYDATDDFIYFTYSKDSCIDVYDLEGIFQYTLYLPDSPNGAPMVYCQDGKTYIECKDSTVFIFEGSKFVKRLTNREEKEQYGYYEITQFLDPSLTGIKITKEYIKRYTEDGTLIFEFHTPDMVRATINRSLLKRMSPKWILITFGSLLAMFIIFLCYKVKLINRNRNRKYGIRLQNPEV